MEIHFLLFSNHPHSDHPHWECTAKHTMILLLRNHPLALRYHCSFYVPALHNVLHAIPFYVHDDVLFDDLPSFLLSEKDR